MTSSIFRQAVKDVKPLAERHRQRVHFTRKKIHINTTKLSDEIREKISLITETHASLTPEEIIFFAQPTLQPKNIKKLRQGKIPIAAKLDLHNMNVNMAKQALEQFLMHCQQQNFRCVLIIHGKGLAILKSAINSWLKNYAETLAFSSATPKDGGAGAIYLLLKKSNL